ncbi:hybrid sensor histidine kinase/response regulator [Massilia sp. YIM B02443]|nr:hybrid sensor histidine kinase/response regulator [Massilia sp. YIM B02443]
MLSRGEVPSSGASGIAEVDRLQHALHDAGAKLSHAAAERAALLQREQEARVLAEQQVETRDNFLAMLSHELRNPLSGIVGATQLLRSGPASAALKERAHDILLRQSKHLTRIVDDLLDLARLARGKVELDMRPLDLAAMTGAIVDALRVGGRVEHTLRCQLAPAWIRGDATRIEQVIGNLVGNALKYTPAGGTVEIALTANEDSGEARLTVRDDGIGITPELLPRLFDIFVQGKVTLDRTQGGLGIGLSVVRSLVALHGGSIEAASAGPGQGSTFTLRLPLLAAQAGGAGDGAAQAAPAGAAAAARQAAPGDATVLLIEDNDDARTVLAAQLAAAGCRVLEAANGVDGIALARQAHPALAIVDIGLPGMDGYQIAAALRAEPALAPMRLLALTGYGQPADRTRALAAGFERHYVKPLRPEQLEAVLEELHTGVE